MTLPLAAIGAGSWIPFVPNNFPTASQSGLPIGQTTFVCNGATPVTVAYAGLTAQSQILVTLKTVGGTVGAIPVPQTVTAGTGFTIQGTASDTSTYNLLIIG